MIKSKEENMNQSDFHLITSDLQRKQDEQFNEKLSELKKRARHAGMSDLEYFMVYMDEESDELA